MSDHLSRESQGDLFDQKNKSDSNPIRKIFRTKVNPVFSISLEHLIVSIVTISVIMILVFMLGVKRGKKIQKIDIKPTTATVPTELVKIVVESKPRIIIQSKTQEKKEKGRQSNVVAQEVKKPYTIQVAAYRSRDRALKEVSTLRAKGFKIPRVIIKGNFYQVCVGQYAGRAEADKDFRMLRSTYKDCYLRKA